MLMFFTCKNFVKLQCKLISGNFQKNNSCFNFTKFLEIMFFCEIELFFYLQDINDFQLLGQSIDNAPGEVFDKIARRLNIYQNYDFRDVPGMYF